MQLSQKTLNRKHLSKLSLNIPQEKIYFFATVIINHAHSNQKLHKDLCQKHSLENNSMGNIHQITIYNSLSYYYLENLCTILNMFEKAFTM